jgi:hypothetical protein
MGEEKGPGDGTVDALVGSSAESGGAGGTDFAATEAAVRQLLDDGDAMAALRGFLDNGDDLRSALGETADAVPSAAAPIATLLANPGVLQDITGSLGGLIVGAQRGTGDAPEGLDLADAGSLLGKLFGGES